MMEKYALLFALTFLMACTGSLDGDQSSEPDFVDPGTGDMSDDEKTPDAGNSPSEDTGMMVDMGPPPPPLDMADGPDLTEEPFEPVACEGTSLGDDFTIAPIAGTTPSLDMQAAGTSNGGAIVAWRNGPDISLTHVDGAGEVVGTMSTPGTGIYGVAAHESGRAVLVSRGSDILALVIFDANGNPVFDETVIGDVDHSVTNNEWFGSQIRAGRLIWTGTQWAAYFTVQRLWDDGIAHYGDQLRLYEPDGSSSQTLWGWGCSHSMDVRLSHNGSGLGAVCSSDCYPSKGVHFNHRGGMLWPDETGSDCRGGYGTTVGASIPFDGGFWAAFTAIDDRDSADVAIARIDGNAIGDPVWLTADAERDGSLNGANFGDDIVIAWTTGQQNQFVVASGTDGATLEGPVSIAGVDLPRSSDFFNFANGDVGWVQPSETGEIGLARLRDCD